MSQAYNTILSLKNTILLYFQLTISKNDIIEKIVYILYNIFKQKWYHLTFSHLIIFKYNMMNGETIWKKTLKIFTNTVTD